MPQLIRTLQRKLKRYGASDWGLKTKVGGEDMVEGVESPSFTN